MITRPGLTYSVCHVGPGCTRCLPYRRRVPADARRTEAARLLLRLMSPRALRAHLLATKGAHAPGSTAP